MKKTDQGEPLFLEGHVDAWLDARYAAIPERPTGDDFMTIREVAQLHCCSF